MSGRRVEVLLDIEDVRSMLEDIELEQSYPAALASLHREPWHRVVAALRECLNAERNRLS